MRRLIAGGAALGQDKEVLAETLTQFRTRFAPVVGAELEFVFADLRRARHVHRQAGEPSLGIARRQNADGVVLVAFDMAEISGVGVAVHGRLTRNTHPAPVAPHDGVAESEGDRSRPTTGPRLANRRHDPFRNPRNALCRGHDVQIDPQHAGDMGMPEIGRTGLGAGMGVRGVHDHLHRVEGGQPLQPLPHLRPQFIRNANQITTDQNGMIVTAVEHQHGGRDRIGHPLGNARVKLAGNGNGSRNRNVGLGPTNAKNGVMG